MICYTNERDTMVNRTPNLRPKDNINRRLIMDALISA